MKKFIAGLIIGVSLFPVCPTLAFDVENIIFEPPMIYSVYEEEGGVIPKEGVILSGLPSVALAKEGAKNLGEDASEPVIPPLNWPFYLEKVKKYAKNYIDDIIWKATWELPEDPSIITYEYINDLEDWQREKLNYERNIYQSDIPLKVDNMKPGEWKCSPNAVAHNLAGSSGNMDCRGLNKRAGQQAIYDANGDLVTSPENMGTFDYAMHHASKGKY